MRRRFDIRCLSPGDEAAIEAFLVTHADSSVFLRSNLQAAGLAYSGNQLEGEYVGAFAEHTLIGVAAHYWNGVVILQAPENAGELARAVAAVSGRTVQGLIGPWAQVSEARAALNAETRPTSLNSKEVLFRLALNLLVVPATLTTGTLVCRPSRGPDLAWLADWRMAYVAEALREPDTPASRSKHLPMMERAHAAGDLFIVEHDGRAVSTCHLNSPAGSTVQIGGVWTPPELRNHGYAQAAVAGALLTAKETGMETAILFTDEENVAATRAYGKIGFKPVGDYGLVFFEDA